MLFPANHCLLLFAYQARADICSIYRQSCAAVSSC